jgi:LmbE family N-acetylglucosaminyl deacetylase
VTARFTWSRSGAELFVPDGVPVDRALARTTHLAVGAHPDDLEIMAGHGILECYGKRDRWFTGVVVCHGGNAPRSGAFQNRSEAEMIEIRRAEQKRAATRGHYSAVLLLNHPSSAVKNAANRDVAADLDTVFGATRPEVLYTHNLADKHDTHVGVALRVIEGVRRLTAADRPRRMLGCEVWRDLDWLADADKVLMRVDQHGALADELISVFESQIAGGKRYDLGARGRRLANATFFDSHGLDQSQAVIWGMDLTPLAVDCTKDPADLVRDHIEHFLADVRDRITRMG